MEQTLEQQTPIRATLLNMQKGDLVSFPVNRLESIKTTTSTLKRKGVGIFRTKLTDTEIIVERITDKPNEN